MQTAIPERLRALLDASPIAGATLEFVECCDQILADNKMPFFPAYTDHGVPHVGSVLEAAQRLIPDAVLEKGILTSEDAVVLVGAIFAHDLALHLREAGFIALVAEESAFAPLPWFREDQRGRPGDEPWPHLWQGFRKEAGRFSQSQLDRILGHSYGELPGIVFDEIPSKPSTWTLGDRLLVGEFLRRHHARLAHEIVVYGFPGIAGDEFPVLSRSLPGLAEAIGAVARSHNEDLRAMSAYLEARAKGNLRPDGAAQLYLMGVLRVADYFQLEPGRATPLLLHLREPQSPLSVEEWKKHQAISAISWDHRDPQAVTVQISPEHTLRTHLQLTELIAALQRELDMSGAVLSETYGSSKLSDLHLSLQRVRTNLHEPDLHARLPFVPTPSRLRSAEDLFRLMVGDLYGNEPAVAGRELLQNAVDAFRERKRWEEVRNQKLGDKQFRDQAGDVLVEVEEIDDHRGLLRVSDRGVGMMPSTVTESFLTAGATYAPTNPEPGESEGDTRVEWMKAGRFGIGVFAAFLLGSEIRVTTRHVEASRGISFTARLDDDVVQLDWSDEAPLGTEIVVPYSALDLPGGRYASDDDVPVKHLGLLSRIAGFFALSKPEVKFQIKRRDGTRARLRHDGEIPSPKGRLPDQWRTVRTAKFDAVLWCLPSREVAVDVFAPWRGFGTNLAHNGFLIDKPGGRLSDAVYEWSREATDDIVATPSLAIFDTKQELKIALNRYELATSSLPFETELLESIGTDVVAHALVRGEEPYPLDRAWGLKPVVSRTRWLPLIPQLVKRHIDGDLCALLVNEPAELKISSRFLKGRLTSAGWRDLPFRTALAPHEAYADELDPEWVEFEDALLQGHAEKEVRYSIDQSAMLMWRFPFAGVLARDVGEVTVLFDDPEDPEAEAMNTLLTEVAEELRAVELHDFFALVVLREHDERWRDREEPLAVAWEDAIGGMLERSPSAREKRRREIGERKRQIRAQANKWERFASRPRPD
jgi:molecular chaperone HtpG